MALRTNWWGEAGTEMDVKLPGASTSVTARTVRSQNGRLGLAFRDDEAMLQQVDAALGYISLQVESQAAA